MSLTNPKDVITEERLSEFYQGILPYLGGMPEMLVNKFSKGDLYSTAEKIVGQWIDGKPLYQKTITMNFPNSSGGESQSDIISDNMDTVFISEAFSVNNDGYTCPIPMLSAGTTLATTRIYYKDCRVYLNNTWSTYVGKPATITVRYTKTTDSPISIGEDTDYSTDEKIVGTWIDGKPIYQKTVDVGNLPNNTEKRVAHNISNLEHLINIFGFSEGTSSPYVFKQPINMPSPNDNIYAMNAFIEGSDICLQTKSDKSMMHGYVTLQYTKTTD